MPGPEGIRYIGFRHEQSAGYAAAASGFLPKTGDLPDSFCAGIPQWFDRIGVLATLNGFPMIMISGSSDRAIVDLQQGDYEELDQMNAANRMPAPAFRVNQRRILALHWHALSGLYRVAGGFILICQQMSDNDDGKDKR